MEQQNKKEPSSTLIYVSNLPFDTTDEQFKDLFKDFTVKTAYVARRKNGRSKGFGFVNLEKESDQTAAIEKVNGKELDSRKLVARIAYNDERRNENGELREEFKTQNNNQQTPSETVVYISNLAWTVNEEELKKIFAEFNPKTVKVATRSNGRSKGFGFVEFNNKEDRDKALSLDQKTFSERAITVKPSTGYRGDSPNESRGNNNQSRRRNDRNRPRRNRRSRTPTKRSPSGNNSSNNDNNNNNNRNERRSEFTIYIKNLPFELDESDLKDVFQEFHPRAANIPRNNGKSKGFGFVEFNNSKDQNDALKALDQSEINGRVVSISISRGGNNNRSRSPRRNRNNNNNRSRSPRRRNSRNNRRNDNNNNNNNNRSEKKSNVTSELSKTNAYVSNIPFSIDEKKLEEFFKGTKINKLTIPRKRNGHSFGYAFVEFASTEDQQKALKLHDSPIEGRKLTVQAAFHRTN